MISSSALHLHEGVWSRAAANGRDPDLGPAEGVEGPCPEAARPYGDLEGSHQGGSFAGHRIAEAPRRAHSFCYLSNNSSNNARPK